MDYPEIADAVLSALDDLGFEGTDASAATSLFEYGGLWSREHGIALLCEEGHDPRVEFHSISEKEITCAVVSAGAGFAGFVDAAQCGLPTGMGAIFSLMQWNGGWHANSNYWRNLSKWDTDELIRVAKTMCQKI